MSTTANTPSKVKFLSVIEFKVAKGIHADTTAQVVKNPNTNKLFLAIGSHTFKCQQDIDPTKDMKMLVDDDNLDEACLANVKPHAENVLFTL